MVVSSVCISRMEPHWSFTGPNLLPEPPPECTTAHWGRPFFFLACTEGFQTTLAHGFFEVHCLSNAHAASPQGHHAVTHCRFLAPGHELLFCTPRLHWLPFWWDLHLLATHFGSWDTPSLGNPQVRVLCLTEAPPEDSPAPNPHIPLVIMKPHCSPR